MTSKLTILILLLTFSTAFSQANFGTTQTNPFGLTTVGDFPSCNLVDLDGDGDLDLLSDVRNNGFRYFENTAGAGNYPPVFGPVQTNPFGLANWGQGMGIAVTDLNGDNLLDILCHDSGSGFKYFENIGTSNAPSFAAQVSNPFGLSGIGQHTDVSMGDMDGDGLVDLWVVGNVGPITYRYYKNTGTANSPHFTFQSNNPFGLNGADIASSHYDALKIHDLNGDGLLDLVAGSETGAGFSYWENTGTANAPDFSSPPNQSNPFGLDGSAALPQLALGDLSGDGISDALYSVRNSPFEYQENGGSGPEDPNSPEPVPTMGEWALIIFALIILSMAMVTLIRWQKQLILKIE